MGYPLVFWGPGGSDSQESTCNVETWADPVFRRKIMEGMATHSSVATAENPMDEGGQATVHGVHTDGHY